MTSNHTGAPPSSEFDGGGENTVEALIDRLRGHVGAAQLAEAAVRTWRDIDGALTPVLGKRGVAALCRRSLHVSARAHDWLVDVRETSESTIDFATLQSTIADQEPTEAFAATAAMLRAFGDLLASLVGASLTRRLLGPVLIRSETGHSPKAL